jgi:hypothetical protein
MTTHATAARICFTGKAAEWSDDGGETLASGKAGP